MEIRDGSPYIGQLGIRWTGKLAANQEEDQEVVELWRFFLIGRTIKNKCSQVDYCRLMVGDGMVWAVYLRQSKVVVGHFICV